jgi:hypothetical protein
MRLAEQPDLRRNAERQISRPRVHRSAAGTGQERRTG